MKTNQHDNGDAGTKITIEQIKAECRKAIELGEKATPGLWELSGTTIYALTPYIGDCQRMASKLPDGINRFSAHVQRDNSIKSGGAPDEELHANAAHIAHARIFSPASARAMLDLIAIFEDMEKTGISGNLILDRICTA